MVPRSWTLLKSWLPIVRITPLSTFRKRFRYKRLKSKVNILNSTSHGSGFAARLILEDHNSPATLVLSRKAPLGDKGFKLSIPRDEVIFEEVRLFGRWESDEVSFLAKALNRKLARDEGQRIFLDIGANTGLISRQVLLKSEVKTRAVLVEPIPSHVEAINFNLRDLSSHMQIKVHAVALGQANTIATIFTEKRNQGNSSLIREAVPEADFFSQDIKVESAEDFARTHMRGSDRIVLKSDAQGFDASILARMPPDFWNRVEAAVIEIWAIPEISEDDVSQCIKNWADFTFVSWSGRGSGRVALEEVASFWAQGSSATKNLFLKKKANLSANRRIAL